MTGVQTCALPILLRVPYYDLGDDPQRNRIYWASAGTPYRAHTVWNTVYEAYYRQTQDPRVRYRVTNQTGDAAIDCCGRVPWYPQEKYTSSASPITLSSGREMRLIEAEKKLRDGDRAGAVALLNLLRAGVGLPPESAPDLEAAWTLLRRERAVELWLEGRQLGDVFRWERERAPGRHIQDLSGRDRCFPIGITELNTNPNLRG